MPTTLPAAPRLALRLYRTARDGARVTFSTLADRQIPLVDGVSILCSLRSEVDAVLSAATSAGLTAKLHRPSHPTPGCQYIVAVSDRTARSEAA